MTGAEVDLFFFEAAGAESGFLSAKAFAVADAIAFLAFGAAFGADLAFAVADLVAFLAFEVALAFVVAFTF